MTASERQARESLYDSEAALRLVDHAIVELTDEVTLAPDDPRYTNLARLSQHLSARCAALAATVESLGAERAVVPHRALADVTDGMAEIDAHLERTHRRLLSLGVAQSAQTPSS